MELGGTLCLEMVRGKDILGRFSRGRRDPQGQNVNKAGKLLYLDEKQLHKA